MTFKAAQEYLESFVDYQKSSSFSYQKSLNLERVRGLLNALKIPYQNLKVIHIAGTKGKGSTAHFCANILAASGNKTGLYTSPHFFDYRERIKVLKSKVGSGQARTSNKIISKKELVQIVNKIRPKLERFRKNSKYGRLSFFEIYTAIAFKYFLEKKVDFVVLETGLGGRLDATNVINPKVSIITHIGFDHIDWLGKRSSSIAYEKAGIIKKNTPVISADQTKSVLKIIKQRARKLNAPLSIFNRDFKAKNIIFKPEYTKFSFFNRPKNTRRDNPCGCPLLRNLKIRVKGIKQVENACLSLFAVEKILNKARFKAGLSATSFRGRFETISKKPLTIMDVAHNHDSFLALADNLKTYYPKKKVILIFAAAQDKDIKKMLKSLKYDRIILTQFDNPRAFKPQKIKEICGLEEAVIEENIAKAYRTAKKYYNRNSMIVIAGSFFLAAEAMKEL